MKRKLIAAYWSIHHRLRALTLCGHCGGSAIQEVYGGYGNVLELPCDYCTGSGRKWWWWR
jgi:hypothetical protein